MRVIRSAGFVLVAVTMAAQSGRGQETLVQAIWRGDSLAVERLLSAGSDPDARDADGVPALMLASLFADEPTLGVLLEHGADPNAADPDGATALMWSIPEIDKVQLLLDHGADINARSTSLNRSPLLVAAAHPGAGELIQLLIENGADSDVRDASGAGPLAVAMRTADVGVIRRLVEAGVGSVEETPSEFLRPTYSRERPEVITYLASLDIPVPEQILTFAANWQGPDLIERWIDQGANVNAQVNPYGRTPLITAASSELAGAETLRVLLENGADPNVVTSEGESPLDWAIYRNDRAKIAVLEEYGAIRGDGPRQAPVASPEPGGLTDPTDSVRESVALLLEASAPMFALRGCITCHHNTLPAMAAATARRKGIAIDEDRVARNVDEILSVFRQAANAAMQGETSFPGGNTATLGYSLMALAAEDYPPDKLTAMLAHWTMASQMPDGRWIGNGVNRPPIEYSTVTHTALAVQGLAAYPIPGRGADVERAMEKAREWLLTAETNSAEERAMRLLGLAGTGLSGSDLDEAIREIVGLQQDTGGWSQLPALEPDAYATGLSLFALKAAGLEVGDAAYRAGVNFLIASQYPDGAWFVRSRALPVQPYFESGFPFGRHQWISAAGTGWAAIAIAETLPDAGAADH